MWEMEEDMNDKEKAEGCRKDWDGNLEITFGENANWSHVLKEKIKWREKNI